MPASNLTSAERLHVYESLSSLNRSFSDATNTLAELEHSRIVEVWRLRELSGLAQELQSEINFHLLEKLHTIETADRYRFGKVRLAREKRLKKPLAKSVR